MTVKIIDDLVPQPNQLIVSAILNHSHFPWYYNKTTIHYNEDTLNFPHKSKVPKIFRKFSPTKNKPQFTHTLFRDGEIKSDYYNDAVNIFSGIIPEFKTMSLARMKANLTYPHKDRSILMPHRDLDGEDGIIYIYYVDDADGPTTFYHENGKVDKVDPVGGRLVRFPATLYHSANVPKKYDRRTVINIVFV